MDSLGRSYNTPKDPTGVIQVTPLRLDVLQFIHRFPYVPTHYMDHWFGANQRHIRNEGFQKAYLAKNVKSFRSSELTGPLALMPKNSWSLTKKGEQFLRDNRPTEQFVPKGAFSDHSLYATLIGTSLYFGAKEAGLGFHFTDEIVTHDNCPPITDPHPFTFSSSYGRLTADARPFKLSHGKRSMFFWGFEADRKTMTLSSEDTNSILGKFKRYADFLDNDIHEKRFGLPNINFLFVTVTDHHMHKMVELLKQSVDEKHWHHFWFTSYADAAPHLDFPPPNGSVLLNDWHTAEGKVSLVNFLKGGGL